MTNENSNKKLNIVLDATMLDTFQLCPTKFHYRFNLNKSTLEKAKPLDKGSLIHIGLETYYLAMKEKVSFDERCKLMKESMQVATFDSELEDSMNQRCINVALEYAKRWESEDERLVIKEVEKSFAYILYEDDDIKIIMIGKIDLLVDYHDDRTSYENLVIDHKTYERDFPLKRMSNQFCNYSYATDSNYVLVNRIGFQTSIKPEVKHKRIPLSYDPVFLEQWKLNTIEVVKNYLDCVSSGKWPMNLTSCDKFNRLCEYYDVCDSSGIEAKIWKLQSLYKDVEKWDVSKSLGLREKVKEEKDE